MSVPHASTDDGGLLMAAERIATRWHNDGGVTREVVCEPAGATVTTADWRISIADVETPGPFSSLPGIDRVLTLIEGSGMVLTVNGTEQVLEPLQPFIFSGDDAVGCRLLGGPTRDLNVMTRRGHAMAAVEVLTVAGQVLLRVGPGEDLVLILLTGALTTPTTGELALLDAVRLSGPTSIQAHGHGTVLVARLTRPR